MKMLRIENLIKTYHGVRRLGGFELSFPNLAIRKGEVLYVLGPNGSGKTTLLELLQGLVEPDSGYVMLNQGNDQPEIDILGLKPYKRVRFFQMVPQDTDSILVNDMSGADHFVAAYARIGQAPWLFPRAKCARKAQVLLGRLALGLENRLSERVGNLSGGERQVIAFSIATVGQPEVLLLDELTGALDPEMAKKVLSTVVGYLRQQQLTALVVTHKCKEAIENADRIVMLHRGKPHMEIAKGQFEFSEQFLTEQFARLYND